MEITSSTAFVALLTGALGPAVLTLLYAMVGWFLYDWMDDGGTDWDNKVYRAIYKCINVWVCEDDSTRTEDFGTLTIAGIIGFLGSATILLTITYPGFFVWVAIVLTIAFTTRAIRRLSKKLAKHEKEMHRIATKD